MLEIISFSFYQRHAINTIFYFYIFIFVYIYFFLIHHVRSGFEAQEMLVRRLLQAEGCSRSRDDEQLCRGSSVRCVGKARERLAKGQGYFDVYSSDEVCPLWSEEWLLSRVRSSTRRLGGEPTAGRLRSDYADDSNARPGTERAV